MKKIGIMTVFSMVLAQDAKPMNQFVVKYLLVTQSKMECSPTVWQDFREGYLRGKAIKFADVLLDSLNSGVSPYKIAKSHFPTIDDLRMKVNDGKEYEFKFETLHLNVNTNYFSSVKD